MDTNTPATTEQLSAALEDREELAYRNGVTAGIKAASDQLMRHAEAAFGLKDDTLATLLRDSAEIAARAPLPDRCARKRGQIAVAYALLVERRDLDQERDASREVES